jgi:hypothetical protein
MKKLITFSISIIISASLLAQKQKQKNTKTKNPQQEARNVVLGDTKEKSNKSNKDIDIIWDGTKDHDGGAPKTSKNQPAKVRSAFANDYPNATNVSWSKYRGDWTATFNNGIGRSVAVYHANGQRKDTRTVVQKTQLPKTIIDGIFKKRPNAQLNDVVKIETQQNIPDIFRIKSVEGGTTRFSFYDANGKEVNYDY